MGTVDWDGSDWGICLWLCLRQPPAIVRTRLSVCECAREIIFRAHISIGFHHIEVVTIK